MALLSTNGDGIIRNRIITGFLILLGLSCVGHMDYQVNPMDNTTHHLWVNFYQTEGELFDVEVFIQSPNPFFTFMKKSDHFKTKAIFTLAVIDNEEELQVYHKTWEVEAIVNFYEDTRSKELSIKSQQSFQLPAGNYTFTMVIIDEDSKHEWKVQKEIEIGNESRISDISPMVKIADKFKFAGNEINLETDTLYLKILIPDDVAEETDSISYLITDMETPVDSGKVALSVDESGFIYIPIKVNKSWLGVLNITVNVGNEEKSIDLGFVNTSIDRYFQDISYLVEVMSVILPYNEYKELKDMKPIEQKSYLFEYWQSRDPTPETDENELLEEFYNRVEYVNAHFGVLSPGWKSDRGMVYIQYGKPDQVESSRDRYGRNYEIWTYQNSHQFVFMDDGFGDYRLYRQTR